jgi:hypothetical protein
MMQVGRAFAIYIWQLRNLQCTYLLLYFRHVCLGRFCIDVDLRPGQGRDFL